MVDVPISETDLLSQVIDLAHLYGWKLAHFRPAMTKWGWRTAVSGDGKGFPDCVLVRPPRLIFAELKAEDGKLRPEQEEWLELLRECQRQAEPYGRLLMAEVYVWRPSQFDEIRGILE